VGFRRLLLAKLVQIRRPQPLHCELGPSVRQGFEWKNDCINTTIEILKNGNVIKVFLRYTQSEDNECEFSQDLVKLWDTYI
jgi:hypothetical protein